MAISNPWLALSTYEEKDQDRFKGREKDIDNMLTMLLQNDCVVCYAASGDGKSSLINAGVCPAMRKVGLFPVKITFTTAELDGVGLPHMAQDESIIDFDQLILDKINQSIERYRVEFVKEHEIQGDYHIEFEGSSKYENNLVNNSLWWKLRTETVQIPFGEFDYVPVLIFDQFEEIFRASWKANFFKWLEILMKDICPDNLIDKQINLPSRKLFKTIFSLRYEFVGELDYWCSQKTFIPQVMQNRYFLKPLSRIQAISVIQGQNGDGIVSEKMKNEADLIVNHIVVKSKNNNDIDEISAIVLSLVCFVLYDKWSEDINYSLNDIDLNDIIYDYYLDKLHKVGVSDNARQSIEEVLISSNNTRLRMPISYNRLQEIDINKYVYTEDGVPNLKSEHLIKIESSNGEDYIEFIHDRLSDAVFKRRESEREEKQAFLRLESKKNLGYFSAVTIFLLFFLFITYKALTVNVWYVDDFIESVDDNKLVVTQFDYKNNPYGYQTATSLSLESNLCLHKLDCYDNVLYAKGFVNYAHNAEHLTFARPISGLDSLAFGKNTKTVVLLYPLKFKKIVCDNEFAEFYVPKGDYDRCIAQGLARDIIIKELGWLSLLWIKLKYEVHIQHTHLFDSDISIPLWLTAIASLLLIILLTRKYWLKYDIYKRIALFAGGSGIFLILSIEVIELHWLGITDSVNLLVPYVILLFIWYVCNAIKEIRPHKDTYRRRCCIIYCSEKGKSAAIKLRKVLIDTRMEGDDDDFALNLSIVRYGEFHPDMAVASMANAKQCIVVFEKGDLSDNNRIKEFVPLLEGRKFLHPVVVGIDNIEDILVPYDVQYFFQRKDIVLFHDTEQIYEKSDRILNIILLINTVRNYGWLINVLSIFIKYVIYGVWVAIFLWLINWLKK